MIIDKLLFKYICKVNISEQKKQILFYKKREKYVIPFSELENEVKEKIKKLLNNFIIFLPKIDKAKLIKCFFDVRKFEQQYVLDLHFIWNDEYFPLSKKIDNEYRKIRKKIFGRIADIESISIYLDEGIVFYPWNNFTIGFYSFPMHIRTVEFLYVPVIFSNSWNHMMSTRWTIDVAKRLGGYYRPKVSYVEGTRSDAEKFAKQLEKRKNTTFRFKTSFI